MTKGSLLCMCAALWMGGCAGADTDARVDCSSDQDCAARFGGGSTCVDGGLCSAAAPCEDDAGCVVSFGAGFSCESGNACFGPAPGDDVPVTADIETDQLWTRANTYRLENVIYVRPGVTLTIEAGTWIVGAQATALVVEAEGSIDARGTLADPIVFTSAQPPGVRAPGDWGGLALLGQASTNAVRPTLEGVPAADRAGFGGDDDESSCGTLQFVRVEYAGFALELDNELNGLTLAGCGGGTIIDHVQVHKASDDGIEVFGGTVDLRNVVITRAQDDSLDYDLGWRGTAQFVAIQQDANGDNGIEASSNEEPGSTPVAAPRLYNVTLIGAGSSNGTRGVNFKDGTHGTLGNALFFGHGIESLDVQGTEVPAALEAGQLAVIGSMFFSAGASGTKYFPTVEDETELTPDDGRDDDDGFDEEQFFLSDPDNEFGTDPGLPDPFNLIAPGWVPGDAAENFAISPPVGFDEGASYSGAFAPNQPAWTSGWTDYSAN